MSEKEKIVGKIIGKTVKDIHFIEQVEVKECICDILEIEFNDGSKLRIRSQDYEMYGSELIFTYMEEG